MLEPERHSGTIRTRLRAHPKAMHAIAEPYGGHKLAYLVGICALDALLEATSYPTIAHFNSSASYLLILPSPLTHPLLIAVCP